MHYTLYSSEAAQVQYNIHYILHILYSSEAAQVQYNIHYILHILYSSEAAQAAMENAGTERQIGLAAAFGAGEASFATGAEVEEAAKQAFDACKLQVYDVENADLCYLAVAAVAGEKLSDDGGHPYEVSL
jgi:hypothetical protein